MHRRFLFFEGHKYFNHGDNRLSYREFVEREIEYVGTFVTSCSCDGDEATRRQISYASAYKLWILVVSDTHFKLLGESEEPGLILFIKNAVLHRRSGVSLMGARTASSPTTARQVCCSSEEALGWYTSKTIRERLSSVILIQDSTGWHTVNCLLQRRSLLGNI
jgi:hypothetical protein